MKYLVSSVEDLEKLDSAIKQCSSFIGFDTESHGPILDTGKSRKKSMLNMYQSSMTGFSLAIENTSYYVPVRHMVGNNIPLLQATRLLETLKKSPAYVCAHHWKHDYHVLQREGLELPDNAFCTLVAAWLSRPDSDRRRGLKYLASTLLGMEMQSFDSTVKGRSFDQLSPKEALNYATDDAVAALRLGEILYRKLHDQGMLDHFFSVEMPTLRMLRGVEDRGLSIERKKLNTLHRELSQEMIRVVQSWQKIAGLVDISSPAKISKYFYEVKEAWSTEGLTRGKATYNGEGDGLYPVHKEALKAHLVSCEGGSLGHEAARLLLGFRELNILSNMFTGKLARIADQYPDGKLHPSFIQTGTETGRFSSSDPNAQQIPSHSKLGRAVKSCFVPAPGNVFVSADYSQLELRLLAHYCKSGPLYDAVWRDEDLHQAVGDELGETRSVGKTINFATVYGASPWKISKQLGISEDEASQFLQRYFDKFPQVKTIKEQILQYAYRYEVTKTFSGRIRRLDGLRALRSKRDRQSASERGKLERIACNTPFQGGGADIVKLAMLDVHKAIDSTDVGIVAQVHDEILVECPEKYAKEVAVVLQRGMEGLGSSDARKGLLRVPLKAEPTIGRDWAECH